MRYVELGKQKIPSQSYMRTQKGKGRELEKREEPLCTQ